MVPIGEDTKRRVAYITEDKDNVEEIAIVSGRMRYKTAFALAEYLMRLWIHDSEDYYRKGEWLILTEDEYLELMEEKDVSFETQRDSGSGQSMGEDVEVFDEPRESPDEYIEEEGDGPVAASGRPRRRPASTGRPADMP